MKGMTGCYGFKGRLLMIFMFLLAPLSVSSALAQDRGPINIGVVAGLSGPFASTGIDVVDGLKIAAELYGTVRGRKINLIIEDSGGGADLAVNKATKLVERDGVVAIIGLTFSGETLAVMAAGDRLRVPLVTTNAAAVQITGANWSPWTFRTIPNDAMAAKALQIFMERDPALKAGSWYLVAHDIAYGRSVGSTAKGAGVKLVGESYWPMTTFDWAPAISEIQKNKPAYALMGTAIGTPFLQFVRQANEFGVLKNTRIVAPIGVADNVITELGPIAEGILAVGQWGAWTLEDKIPSLRVFNEKFFADLKRVPPFQAISSAAGMQLLIAAMNKAISVSPDEIVKALKTIEADTIVGRITMRAEDHQALAPLFQGKYQKLARPKYGATVGLNIEHIFSGKDVAPPPSVTRR